MHANKTKSFVAVFAVAGRTRQAVFDAADIAEARETCSRWGAGLQGEAACHERPAFDSLPEAYEQKEARRLLGGISRSTLYRELALERLTRMPGTRRLLVTRESIELRKQVG